ncbi:MAG: hypothetical protein ACLFVQ_07125 [Chitinispirillaceae bacterium]
MYNRKLHMVDSIAPFFIHEKKGKEQNWSKIPFSSLDNRGGRLDKGKCEAILEAFSKYCGKVSDIGFDTITLDDLAHMTVYAFYSQKQKEKREDYRLFYRALLSEAEKYGLGVFINSDVMFFNEEIRSATEMKFNSVLKLMGRAVKNCFNDFPQVSGIVFRFGECDGVDVDGDFTSRLIVKTPKQLRTFIRFMLPIFERHDKLLIIRTWSLGAFRIGDLIWNRDTYHKAFGHISSDHLAVSFKYGESDFFRHLNFNRLFFDSPLNKIIEVQARREYEGFGEFPSFIGYDYEKLFSYLSMCQNVMGVTVWCQTGGWSHFGGLSFIDGNLWNEVNAYVTLRLFKDRVTVEDAVRDFVSVRKLDINSKGLLSLLRLSDRVVKELWYLPEFSCRRMYFRRSRVPPLLWVVWDTIIINHTMRKLLRRLVHERKEAIHDGYRTLYRIKHMKKLAQESGIKNHNLDFMYDTFEIIAAAREFFLSSWNPAITARLEKLKKEYEEKHPRGFHIECDFSPVKVNKRLIKLLFDLAVRSQPQYRIIDRLIILRATALIYPLVNMWKKKRLPQFVERTAMGIQVFFK